MSGILKVICPKFYLNATLHVFPTNTSKCYKNTFISDAFGKTQNKKLSNLTKLFENEKIFNKF